MGKLATGRGQDDGSTSARSSTRRPSSRCTSWSPTPSTTARRVVTGGTAPEGPGTFYTPTVLLGVPAEAQINSEEIFGPVAPITTFASEEEAIERANATEYGLASYAYTHDLGRTIRLAERWSTAWSASTPGLISNAAAPFGGVKSSGFGREGGFEGIEEYLDTTYVSLPG